jgi:hypothetical protein
MNMKRLSDKELTEMRNEIDALSVGSWGDLGKAIVLSNLISIELQMRSLYKK